MRIGLWRNFGFSEIESELTCNDLRIVWLKMQLVFSKPTIRRIMHRGPMIAKIGFQASNLDEMALQSHVWRTFVFQKSELN